MPDDFGATYVSPTEALNIGLARDRLPQTRGAMLPTGTVVVSADNHLPLTTDLFYERFPAHLKEKAPRIRYDEKAGLHQMTIDGMEVFPAPAYDIVKSVEDRPGCQNMAARMREIQSEGIEKEIVFPQSLMFFFKWPDFEVRKWIFRVYNEYLAEQQALEPTRFFPVGIPNYWEPKETAESIREIARLGLKAMMLPMAPGKRSDGSNIIFQDPECEPMWSAIEDSGIPVFFHTAERLVFEGLNGYPAAVMDILGPMGFRLNFGQLVFGRILDKFPALKIVFAEANLNWIPGALQDAEMIFDTHAKLCDSLPDHRPSHYWHKNCYATFMWDPAGLALIETVGPSRAMWSVDYPHHESTFGFSQTAMQAVVEAVSADDARKMLGGTAIELFGL